MVCTNFSANFWTFRNFRLQFRGNCCATKRRMWELCSASKTAISCEKNAVNSSKSAINSNSMLVRTMYPSNARCSWLGARNQQKNKQKKQTPYFPTYSRRALYDLPQTLHGDTARRAHHKSWDSFFDPTHSFSYRVHGKIWSNLPTRGFSAISPYPVKRITWNLKH